MKLCIVRRLDGQPVTEHEIKGDGSRPLSAYVRVARALAHPFIYRFEVRP